MATNDVFMIVPCSKCGAVTHERCRPLTPRARTPVNYIHVSRQRDALNLIGLAELFRKTGPSLPSDEDEEDDDL